MAEKLKVELQDENGNVYYLHTDASVVFCEDGQTVEAKMLEKIDQSAIVQNATTAATNKVVSAAVAKALQEQITEQNTNIGNISDIIPSKGMIKIDNIANANSPFTPSTGNGRTVVFHFVNGATNVPSTNFGLLITFRENANYGVQIAAHAVDGVYYRQNVNGSISAWTKL